MPENSGLPARAVRHVGWRAGRAVSATTDAFRRGDRTVVMTPPVGLRFGNWLYLWLQAHSASAAGHLSRVLEAPGMAEWFTLFPALRDLTIPLRELRFHDRRQWDDRYRYQRFGEDYSREALTSFVTSALTPHITPDTSDTIVVNVRRGDYYSQEHLRARYAFDHTGYLRAALRRITPARRIRLVSDDPDWCRHHLGDVLGEAAHTVTYDPPGARDNFVAVSSARRLIGTNSTFSYWGGYVANMIHDDAQVVMPRFHARTEHGSDAYQLDPRWTILDGFN